MRFRESRTARSSGLARAIVVTLSTLVFVNGCRTAPPRPESAAPALTSPLLYHDARPLTFAGRRTGEGYFSADGRQLVFQSEREPGNPFYQIYRMRFATGETTRVSPGIGRATCGFFHPDGRRILFASTHEDPDAELAQAIELEQREKGETHRYSWDFDPHYDLYLAEPDGRWTALAKAEGYDAEGSISPDGRLVVFASNRHAYHDALSAADRDRLASEPAFFVDLHLLELATGRVRQLTTARGYDGGPFFSADGRRIVFRRFSEDGARAEILTIDVDGENERTLTQLGAMSWAPYFHPSGDYVIFATNRHGFDNFELYLVDADGARAPVRVTDRPGFDGLPVFSPAGDLLVWTSNRTAGKKGQLFRADWDDAAARAALGLPPRATDPATSQSSSAATARADAPTAAPLPLAASEPGIRANDFRNHVAALTDPRTEGRGTRSPGERLAADYVARTMGAIGLEPAGERGTFRHPFEYSAGIALGPDNRLAAQAEAPLALDVDWRPLAFSKSGELPEAPVVFAGYGLVAPAEGAFAAVDEYAGLDVAGRWVMVLRDLPTELEPAGRQALQRYASLRHKAMIARDRGAVGILFVNGPRSGFREPMAALRSDAAFAGSGLAVLALRDAVADRWLAASGRTLAALQQRIDESWAAASKKADGEPARFELPTLRVAARVDLETLRSESANVVGRLQVGAKPSAQTIVLGAHLDHLGRGEGSGSLATAEEAGQIHFGADDNASGVAVLLEIAESLAARRSAGEDLGRRDFVFAAWSGEELGLLGSDRWVDEHVNPHTHDTGPVAYLNFDMVGRLDEELVLHGAGSSPEWAAQIERAALPGKLALALNDDAYLPTDSTSFYTRGLPILSAFTGIHPEYHTPRDRPELLDAEGAAEIAGLFARLAVELSRAEAPPEFVAQPLPANQPNRGGLRVFLGTIPDYSETDVRGVLLSGVSPGGPADAAGLQRGDTIVEVDGQPIENLYDFTYALEALRVDVTARITVLRDGEPRVYEVVPRSRD
ncbi:MAG: M28 family peptidase [Deltaproteobacteria bacterium]|nr:M28 family peptidase [Deltaproteobacteria bacterium]